MKTGNRLKKWKILAAGLAFITTASAATAPVVAGSLLSVTGEAQIRPIEDGSGKYILKSDGTSCLKTSSLIMVIKSVQHRSINIHMIKIMNSRRDILTPIFLQAVKSITF